MSTTVINEEKVKLLLDKVQDVYYDTLDMGEYGSSDAAEIILGKVLSEIMKADILNRRKIEKVLQFLPPHPECLWG
jgi:hypothetical protein